MEKIINQKERGEKLSRNREQHYYLEEYGILSVGELLLVLEDDNWHTVETLLECIAHQDYAGMIEMCKVIIDQHNKGSLTPELSERDLAVYKKVREFVATE